MFIISASTPGLKIWRQRGWQLEWPLAFGSLGWTSLGRATMCDTDSSCDITGRAAPPPPFTPSDFGPVYRILRSDEGGAPAHCIAEGLTWTVARRECGALNAQISAQYPGRTMARPVVWIDRALPTIHRKGLPVVGDLVVVRFASERQRGAGGVETWREWLELGPVVALNSVRVRSRHEGIIEVGKTVGFIRAAEVDTEKALALPERHDFRRGTQLWGHYETTVQIAHAIAPALRPGR